MAFLKKVNVPQHARLSGYAAAEYPIGTWVKLDGFWSTSDVAALGANAYKPGYAQVGDKKLTKITTSDDNITGRVGIVDKLIYIPEDSDTDHDDIAAGQSCIYYTEGQFETDQYATVSGTGAAFGNYLKVNDDGKLIEEATATTETSKSVARVIKVNDSTVSGETDFANESIVFEILK
jgi:hypothetical protein